MTVAEPIVKSGSTSTRGDGIWTQPGPVGPDAAPTGPPSRADRGTQLPGPSVVSGRAPKLVDQVLSPDH